MKYVYDYTYIELKKKLALDDFPKFRIQQILDGLYKSKALNFKTITTLSKDIKSKLLEKYVMFSLKAVKIESSKFDKTTKFLFSLEDGNVIEAVAIPNSKKQFTLCISSQVGCSLHCAFCASGHFGFTRNLAPHEIVEQILYIKKQNFDVTNIVFMGIGEPLLNYDNVLQAIEILNDKNLVNLGSRRITISTSGIIDKILDLAHTPFQIKLSVSLHFPDEKLRNKYMPVNKSYPLKDLIQTLEEYQKITNKIITFEYILFKNINDNLQIADDMRKLLAPLNYKINLIPYNEIEGYPFKQTSKDKIKKFYYHLKKKGVNVTLRQEHGQDINAACGQLRLKALNQS